MTLRIDPTIALVWRSPSTLQLGFNQPLAVIAEITPTQELMIAALTIGVSRSGLDMIGRADSDTAAAELLNIVAPALEVKALEVKAERRDESERSRAVPAVCVLGTGLSADLLRGHVSAAGITLVEDDADRDAAEHGAGNRGAGNRIDFAVVIANFVIEPELHGRWLRRDIPHLPIVIGDRLARVGPLIEPGLGPCLYCVERSQTDADPARPAIAAQLWGRKSTLDAQPLSGEIAALAFRMTMARLGVRTGGAAPAMASADRTKLDRTQSRLFVSSIDIDARTGERREQRWSRHAQCACGDLQRSVLTPASANSPGALTSTQMHTDRARTDRARTDRGDSPRVRVLPVPEEIVRLDERHRAQSPRLPTTGAAPAAPW